MYQKMRFCKKVNYVCNKDSCVFGQNTHSEFTCVIRDPYFFFSQSQWSNYSTFVERSLEFAER